MFKLSPLPYSTNELEPVISKETISFHYGKHQQTYVNNLNNILKKEKPELLNKSLEYVVLNSKGKIFNNAAQIWNHTFYWKCLTPINKYQTISNTKLIDAINKTFGTFDLFKETFTQESISAFGSGWSWLVMKEDGKLDLMITQNAGCPIKESLHPLFTCDLWEHAYYIDYRNARLNYINQFWKIINWKFIENQFLSFIK